MESFITLSGTNCLLVFLADIGPSNSIFSDAERLTLSAALVLAVAVLWRTLAKKDDLVIKATETVTQALISASESNRELRHTIEESVRTKQELRVAVDELRHSIAVLPCTHIEEEIIRMRSPKTRESGGGG